jgi:hypothetical protein
MNKIYVLCPMCMLMPCPHNVFLDVIILVPGQEYTSWSFSLCIFLQSPVSSSLLGTNFLKHAYVLCLNLVFTYLPYSKWNESSRNPPKPIGFLNPSHVVADFIVITHKACRYGSITLFFKKYMNIQICLITAESFTCSQASLGGVVSFFFTTT